MSKNTVRNQFCKANRRDRKLISCITARRLGVIAFQMVYDCNLYNCYEKMHFILKEIALLIQDKFGTISI